MYPTPWKFTGHGNEVTRFESPTHQVSCDASQVDLENEQIEPADPTPPLSYVERRRRAYPPIGDQLDAIWKGGDAYASMLAVITEIKTSIPKE